MLRLSSKPVAIASAAPSVHVVNHGDTLLSIARRNHVPVAELARANNLDPSAKAQARHEAHGAGREDRGRGTCCAAGGGRSCAAPAAAPLAPPVDQSGCGDSRSAANRASGAGHAKCDDAPAAETPVKASEATGALPTFRWPVRGKVITAYGAKANGKANDGINLAVPEGTPVKAAEDGVVAYSGNELKGYGNLVLVRHANGYVTAYAHASELLVKRGDTIKRGQVIAKSGQSGEVGSPQLHFEIRKGSSPVDPLQFLNGA